MLLSCAAKKRPSYYGTATKGGIMISAVKVRGVDLGSLQWTEVDLNVSNDTGKTLYFDPSSIYLMSPTREQFNAYTELDINTKILLSLPIFQASDFIPYYGLVSVIKRANAQEELRKYITQHQFRGGDILNGARKRGLVFFDHMAQPDHLVVMIEETGTGDLKVVRTTSNISGLLGSRITTQVEQSEGEAKYLEITIPLKTIVED